MTPPAVIYWFIIHPFIGFWRRKGLWVSYTAVTVLSLLFAVGLYWARGFLLGPDLGTVPLLWLPGAVLYGLSAWLSVLARRQLTLKAFVGLPEISAGAEGSVLLDQGIYGVVRHPRYLSVIVGIAGFSLFVNYLGAYVIWLGTSLALLLLIPLEERELTHRFGQAYVTYRDRVPALVPRLFRKAK
jgi:protein-S-isoprenylcysteine O-methyltransferase Ste14